MKILNLEKKEERGEDSFAHLINLPSPKGREKKYIYIKIGRFQFTSCERSVGSIPTMETMERWKERKRIDIKIEGSGIIIIRLIMRVERVFATANLEAGPRINNECVAERASACVKLA